MIFAKDGRYSQILQKEMGVTITNLEISEASLEIFRSPNIKNNYTVLFFEATLFSYLFMIPNIFLIDHHWKTSIKNFWYCRICQNPLMFLHGTSGRWKSVPQKFCFT